jgi:oxygen-independent coproporphyrinogen-3 oxidase
MTPAEADGFATSAAAYVHIPFCSAICPYCDFAVVAGRDDMTQRYISAVCSEIARSEAWAPLEAIYLGGGTPSHVDPSHLGTILSALADRHGTAHGAEVSLEANPEDFSEERAAQLRELGFNRVSFGAQSFDSHVLQSLGRRHGRAQIRQSVEAARRAGFENVSIDLIYGTPGETGESWLETLNGALSLGVDHLSCYALTVEGGTPLGRAVASGAAAPDPDTQADRYEMAESVLGGGMGRYEVSNWARPGFECRYNLTVWAQGEYEGHGNGAHGYRKGDRFRNHRRLDAYIDRVESGNSPRAGVDHIEGWEAELDRLFVGLRRTVGVAPGPGTDALLRTVEGRALLEAGVLALEDDRVRVAKPLLTDAVHRSVLGLGPPIVVGDGNA